jgi:hypothetical protein
MGEFMFLILIVLLIAGGVGASKKHDTIKTTYERADGKKSEFETKVYRK